LPCPGPSGSGKKLAASPCRVVNLQLLTVVAYACALILLVRVNGWVAHWPGILYAVILVPPAGWIWWRTRNNPDRENTHEERILLVMAGATALYLVSSATRDPFFFLLGWVEPDQRAWGSLACRWALCSAFFALIAWKSPRFIRLFAFALPLVVIATSAVAFARETGLSALYRDDHPSFLFRIWIFSESFPQLIYYNPLWNGGKIATYVVASGATGPGLLFLPFLWIWPIEQIYSTGLLVLFLGILPAVACLAVRQTGARWSAAFLAAAFAAGTCWGFFRWLFEFGTVGACFAGGFLLPVACLLYKLFYTESFSWKPAAALVICSCFFLSWPGYWLISLALIPPLLLSIRTWNRTRIRWLAGCGAVIAVCIAPLIASVLLRVDVGAFAEKGALSSPGEVQPILAGLTNLAACFRELHPAILWCGIFCLPVLRILRHQLFVASLILPLLIMAGWGDHLLGGLALSRASLPLAFVATWPAAILCDRILSMRDRAAVIVAPFLMALLLIGGYATTRFYANESQSAYRTMPDDVKDLVDWIRNNTGKDARILFAGMTQHAYGGGHVAALPYFTGREMMAADYYQFSPKLVEYFYPPSRFREKDEDVFRFFELYNVSHIIAYDEPSVIRFYRKYPEMYEETHTISGALPKTIFRVKRPHPSYFAENQGQITAGINRLDVRLATSDVDAVIRYNHSPELIVTPPAELFSHDVDGQSLIGIHPNGLTNLQIRFTGIL